MTMGIMPPLGSLPNRASLPHASPYNPFLHIDHVVEQEGRPFKCHEIIDGKIVVDPHSIEALRIRLGSQKSH